MIDVPVLVKDALRDGRRLKNYRILVLNDDGTTDFVIDNNTLVSETVDIDERMCSGDTIKFGLCEGSSIEFQYFNHPSIYGRRIQVFVDVWSDYVYRGGDPTWHDLKTLTETDGTFTVVNPGTYKLDYVGPQSFEIQWTRNGVEFEDEIFPVAGEQTKNLGDLVAGDTIRAYTSFAHNTFSVELKGYYADGSNWYPIPIGFFTVEKCSRQASTGIKKVTAYNKLKSEYLDQKANAKLEELFTGENVTVSVYDIERLLLNEYAIDRSGRIPVGWQRDSTHGHITGTVSIGYASTTSRDNPFNYYMWSLKGGNLSKKGKIDLRSSDYYQCFSSGEPSSTYYLEVLFLKGDFETFERNVYNQFISILNGAGFENSVTGESIFADIERRWSQFCGFSIESPSISTEMYSTIQYEYEQSHGLNYCKGTAKDFLNRIHDVPLSSHTKICIHLPDMWSFYNESTPDLAISFYFDGYENTSQLDTRMTYQYTQDGNVITKDYPFVYYSNGEIYKRPPNAGVYGVPVDTIFNLMQIIGLTDAEMVESKVSDLPEFTLREIMSADYETVCQFGKLDRETDLFSGVDLNNSRLYPAEDLYPADNLYPDGSALSSEKSMYSKLWADEGNVQKWRNLIITYKGLDENNQEKDFTLERQINADGTQDYNMSDNWLFKNLIWTASQVGDYADAMVAKMQDMTWFPFEMWCAGLPYLETGDELEISIGQTTYTSYVLQRQLKGIQNLQDTYINGTLDIF